MAIKHRKLFPTTPNPNQTQDCSDFCDPSCPYSYNCYAFPYYYFPPPPPPPPISAAEHTGTGNHISSYLIILASLFTVIFVLVGFYVVKVKCYSDWFGRRVNGPASSQSDNSEEELFHGNQVDHPVWFITTIGLQQSIINSITVCKYKRGEGLIEGTDCSVCLNEFREDETLRLLPKCNHAFHIPCIDTWLRSHTNCPLCRAGIVSNNLSVSPEASMSNLVSVDQNATSLRRNQEIQTESARNGGELSTNMLVIATGDSENRAGTRETQEFTDELNLKERANQTENQQVLNDEIQTEMSSASICSGLTGSSCHGPGLENYLSTEPGSVPIDYIEDDTEQHWVNLLKQHGDYSTSCQKMRRSSVAECLHVSPVSMKRSFSCSGRILSTKGYRSLNSTLPY